MLTLYYAPGTSSFAVHIALHEVGAKFESRPLSFDKQEQRAPEYLKINPEGKVPTLLIDGRPLTEVAGILFYLARGFPKARLLPEGAEEQAHAVSWMSFIASTLHPARKSGAEYTMKVYGIADARLKGRQWALGEYSITDIHLFRLYWRLKTALDFPEGTFPNLAAHHEAMMKREAVKKTIQAEASIGYELPAWFPGREKDHYSAAM
jgi:glutathione S-transferase